MAEEKDKPVPKIAEMAKQAREAGSGGKSDAPSGGEATARPGDRFRAAAEQMAASAHAAPELPPSSMNMKPLFIGIGVNVVAVYTTACLLLPLRI